MHRYTLTLPEQLNDGHIVPREIRSHFENRLLGTFGGFTATQSLGANVGERVYVEPVTVYTLDADDDMRHELHEIAADAARELSQESVYVTHIEPDGAQSRAFIPAAILA